MGESLEWNRARDFLRGAYGGHAIKKMLPPIGTGSTWIAEVVKDGRLVKIEFHKTNKRRWFVLNENEAQ
jgi:hypothetical protein